MKYTNWLAKFFYYHESCAFNELESDDKNDVLLYDVTFIPQDHHNMCVEASIAMMKKFADLPFHSLEGSPRFCGGSDTISPEHKQNLLAARETISFEYKGMKGVRDTLENYGPFMTSLPIRCSTEEHQVVVVGCTNTHLICHDPLENSGYRCINFKDLQKIRKITDVTLSPNLEVFRFRTTPDHLPQKLLDSNKRIATKLLPTTKYSGFFSMSTGHWSEFNAYTSVIHMLEDYVYGSKLWNPFRHHRQDVEKILSSLKSKKRDLIPQSFYQILDAQLPKCNPEGTLQKMVDTIKVYIPRPPQEEKPASFHLEESDW